MYLPTLRQLPRLVLSKNVLYELAQKSKTFFHFLGPKTESTVFLERLDSLPQQEIITMAFVVVVASL